jgi:hypothetical protein
VNCPLNGIKWIASAAVAAWAGTAGHVRAAENETDLNLETFPSWDNTFTLRTWSGYKDNVLFSHENAGEPIRRRWA